MKLRVAAKTDAGRLSDHNEDYLLARDDLGLYLVADGVGGLQAGELASAVACRIIEQTLVASLPGSTPSRHDRLLADAIQQANLGLFHLGQEQPDRRGIGTTLVALWFHGDRALFAYVGDSRIYLYRDGLLRQLSKDEKVGRFRLAASLGQDRTVDVRMGMVRLRPRDRFLLCTDGLHGPVPRRDLVFLLDSERDPAACCRRLVARANERGGPDNITALVADVAEPGPPQGWRFSRVRSDATSLVARLRRPWFAATVLSITAVVVFLWAIVSLTPEPKQAQPPALNARIAVLAREANARADQGDRAGALASLKDLVREAVRSRCTATARGLGLKPAVASALQAASDEVWDELYAPIRQKLASIEGTQASQDADDEIREVTDRIEGVHQQFRSGHYEHVAEAFETLADEVEAIVSRATSDYAEERSRLSAAIPRLRSRASEFAAGNPIRRALEEHLAQAAKALEAGNLKEARKHVDAAEAALSGDSKDPEGD